MKIDQEKVNQFAVCLDNQGYEVSLEVGKIYRVINRANDRSPLRLSQFDFLEMLLLIENN